MKENKNLILQLLYRKGKKLPFQVNNKNACFFFATGRLKVKESAKKKVH